MKKDLDASKRRVLFLLVVILSGFAFLSYNVITIMFSDGKEYRRIVLSQRTNSYNNNNQWIEPQRGTIHDRNGIALAESLVLYNIIMNPKVINNTELEAVQQSMDLLTETMEELSEEILVKIVNDRTMSQYEVIARNISLSKSDLLREYIEDGKLIGISLEQTNKRIYPYNNFAANVIGHYSYKATSGYGIEGYYNDYLKGSSGRRYTIFSEDITVEEAKVIDGDDVFLNIDYTIQNYVEEDIKIYSEKYTSENIRVIIMNPNNGDILAMASYPTYNLNNPYDLSSTADQRQLDGLDNSEKLNISMGLWRNSNISDGYEPGSTFKPFTVAMALEERLVDPEQDYFYCPGFKIPYPGVSPINCWKLSGHGTQNLFEALSNSCNVVMMDVAMIIGKEHFFHYQSMFGIGSITGIDLPGDVSLRNNVYQIEDFGPVELQTSAFGQGQSLTPLQLISGFSALINGGYLYQPSIMKQIISDDGTLVEENEKVILGKPISEEVSELMRKALGNVVSEGTGKSAQIEGYAIGGKTGTAEVGNREVKDYIVSFIGFSPVKNPEVITLVVIDKPVGEKVDSRYATELFRNIMVDVLPYLRTPKEDD